MARRRRPPRAGAVNELPPLRILGQIAALQSIYYAVALVLMLFTSLVSGTRFGLDLVFGWASLRGDTTQGWLLGFIWLCCAGVTSVSPQENICKNYIDNRMVQYSSDGSLDRSIKTRARFRAQPPLHPPRHRYILYRLHTTKRRVVDYDARLKCRYGRRRHVRLPVERIATY